MSATCIHAEVDAWDHPACPGCALIIEEEAQETRIYFLDGRTSLPIGGRRELAPVARRERARPRQSLLDRAATPEDIEAERDAPRPGVWAGEDRADLRPLTQDETDALVRTELNAIASAGGEGASVLPALGGREGFGAVRVDLAVLRLCVVFDGDAAPRLGRHRLGREIAVIAIGEEHGGDLSARSLARSLNQSVSQSISQSIKTRRTRV